MLLFWEKAHCCYFTSFLPQVCKIFTIVIEVFIGEIAAHRPAIVSLCWGINPAQVAQEQLQVEHRRSPAQGKRLWSYYPLAQQRPRNPWLSQGRDTQRYRLEPVTPRLWVQPGERHFELWQEPVTPRLSCKGVKALCSESLLWGSNLNSYCLI